MPASKFKDLPATWELKEFGDLAKITCGVAATPNYVDESMGVPFLSARNVQNEKLDLSKYLHISRELHEKLTKNTKPMAFVTLEDFTGSIEIIVFTECLEAAGKLVQEDKMVLVMGKVSTKENEVAKVLADEIIPLSKASGRFAEHLLLEVDAGSMNDEMMEKIESLLQTSPGSVNVLFLVNINSDKSFTVRSNKYQIAADTALLDNLQHLLGEHNVRIVH